MSDEIKEILDEMKFMQEKKVKFYSLDIYQSKLLLDYITNLQQENERLKQLDENYPIEEELAEAYRREEDYKSRIEKAVEYLNKHKKPLHHSFDEPDCDYWIATNPQDIIDILNGRSDK